MSAAKEAGLEPVARLLDYPDATPAAIDAKLTQMKSLGVRKIIFQGDQILGFKGAVEDTAKALIDNGLYFGRVEFSKQKGEETLAQKAKGNIIVVHSITQNEMPQLNDESIVERFQRGVRERGVRMCYVRMYDTASANLVADNAAYVNKIARSITKAGYVLHSSHPVDQVKAPKVARIAAGLGVAAGGLLLILAVVDLSPAAMVGWAIATLVVCAGFAGAGETGRKGVALLCALIFPTLAAVNAVQRTPELPTAVARPLLRAWGRMLLAVATVCVGGTFITGLLSERDFMLRVNQFMGIKAAHLLPVMALIVLFAGGVAWRSGTWTSQKTKLLERLREVLSNPILLWEALGVLVLLGVVGLMVARSGNDSGVGVSSLELRFRAILDKVLYVRPRTKEIPSGLPAAALRDSICFEGQKSVGRSACDRGLNRFDISLEYILPYSHPARAERVAHCERSVCG